MKNILEMTHDNLLNLRLEDVDRLLTADEMVHIATTLGAFWSYDYEAARQGKPGLHALLKSGQHSDGFFYSKILLEPKNICQILANQIVMRLREKEATDLSECIVIGIPDGATVLGEQVAEILGAPLGKMEKVDGKLRLNTLVDHDEPILLIEDFSTRGTGFKEAVEEIRTYKTRVYFIPYAPVILNRGGRQEITVLRVGTFKILPIVERRIEDWDPKDCPLCKAGSQAIKPKETDENWQRLIASQK